MEIKELQEKAEEIINQIDEKTGAKHDVETTTMHLCEETGEICRAIINLKFKKESTNIENLKQEIADVILLTSKLANSYGIDIEKSIKDKIEKLKQRHNL